MPALSSGILNQNQFNFTFNSSNGFPLALQVQFLAFEAYLNIRLNQVEGLAYNSSIYSKIWIAKGVNFVQMKSNDLVIRETSLDFN